MIRSILSYREAITQEETNQFGSWTDECHSETPITGQLNLDRVATDLGFVPTLTTDCCLSRGKLLVPKVKQLSRNEFSVPDPRQPDLTQVVKLATHNRQPVPKAWCSCTQYSGRLCEHGAAVLMSDYSETYEDWQSLEALRPPQRPTQTPELPPMNSDERKFYAILRRSSKQLATVGLDLDMVVGSYCRKYHVATLDQLDMARWAVIAAEVEAAIRDKDLLRIRATELKALLTCQPTPKEGKAAGQL